MHVGIHNEPALFARLLPESGYSPVVAASRSQRVLYVLCVSVLVTNPQWLIVLR